MDKPMDKGAQQEELHTWVKQEIARSQLQHTEVHQGDRILVLLTTIGEMISRMGDPIAAFAETRKMFDQVETAILAHVEQNRRVQEGVGDTSPRGDVKGPGLAKT